MIGGHLQSGQLGRVWFPEKFHRRDRMHMSFSALTVIAATATALAGMVDVEERHPPAFASRRERH